MSFVDVKLLNSDFLNEPLNYLAYIDSIEKYGDNSYMFDQDSFSKARLQNILSNSTVLFTHKNINECLIRNLKSDDLYYFFKNNKKLGQCLNMLLGDNYFSNGDFNQICEYMNMTAIRALNDEFLHAFGMVIEEKLESENALNWINERFGVDLSSYSDLSSVILNTDGWKLILSNNQLMACACTSQWFSKKVVEARNQRIWRTTTGDYYYDDGTHYSSDGVADGQNIAVEALQMLQENKIVTEEYLTIVDSAYQRLEDALIWFAQNESISVLKGYKELLDVFIANDACCQYLANYPDVLTTCLEDLTFAKEILGSTLALEKIASSEEASTVLNDFKTGINTSFTSLTTIKNSLNLIPQNKDKLYRSDDVNKKVVDTISTIEKELNDITSVKELIS